MKGSMSLDLGSKVQRAVSPLTQPRKQQVVYVFLSTEMLTLCSHEGKFCPATIEKAAYLDRGHLGYTQQFLKVQRLTCTFPGMLRKADCSGHQDHGALVTNDFNGVLVFGPSPHPSVKEIQSLTHARQTLPLSYTPDLSTFYFEIEFHYAL